MTVPPDGIRVQGMLLACEGTDDEAFFRELLQHLRITGVDLRRYHGKPQLPTFLLGLRDSTEFESLSVIGIVRDADTSARSAFQSVGDRLQRLQLHRPRRPGVLSAGRCDFDGMTRTFGVFIMPDNRSDGALEDLCLAAIGSTDALTCVHEFLDCVHARTGIVCPKGDAPKARLNAWLASRLDPTLRLGHAIASRDIDPESQAFDGITAFLSQLAAAAQPPAE